MKESYFIKEVIVGPTPHPELSIEAVRGLFESRNHPEVMVRLAGTTAGPEADHARTYQPRRHSSLDADPAYGS
jgi:hypothetical protein